MRACPSCSVVSETEKGFCPECGTSYERSSTTTAENPGTARTKDTTVKVLAVVGLAAYLLAYLVVLSDEYWGLGDSLKWLSGYQAITQLDDDFAWGLFNLLQALLGYVLLAVVIVSSKKPS